MPTHTPLAILLEVAEENRLSADDFTRALNAAKVRSAKPRAIPAKMADGGGLALYIPPSGAKVWRYRYRLAGKEQTLTIGAFPEISLEHARIAHRAARWLVARGLHPLAYAESEAKCRSDQERRRLPWSLHRWGRRWRTAEGRCHADGTPSLIPFGLVYINRRTS